MAKKITRKKRNSKKKKEIHFTSSKFLLCAVLTFWIVAAGIVVFEYKDGLLYYLGFKVHKKAKILTAKERELVDIHIYEVLNTHKNHVAGIDVSEYQGNIDWENLGNIEDIFPVQFVIVRATAGDNKVDKKFKTNWQSATNKKIIKGAYHYYRPNENSIKQANHFIQTVTLKKGDLPPILDIEEIPIKQSMDSLKIGLKRWLTKVEEHYQIKPIIYSGENYYTNFLQKEFAEYEFWIANYNFWQKSPENNWLMWQFTDKAQINGVKGMVDVNLLNGDFVRLVELTKK